MAKTLPLKRKIEEAFAGWLIDLQAADPTFLPGLKIICAHTSRSPDDPASGQDTAITPPVPYLVVYCGKTVDDPGFPSGYGIKHAFPMFSVKTESNEQGRAAADEHAAEIEDAFIDIDAIRTALNQPADAQTPDDRRVTGLYLYDLLDLESDDEPDRLDDATWDDALVLKALCQGFDPAYE